MARGRYHLKAKTSIAYKFTAYFVVFGIIIGYMTFLFLNIYNAKHFFDQFRGAALKDIHIEDVDFSRITREHFEELAERFMNAVDNETFPVRAVSIYLEKPGEWTFYTYHDGTTETGFIDPAETPEIRKALSEGIVFTGNVFLGKSDITTIYISIPSPENYGIVISASIFREGLDLFVRNRTSELVIFGLILLVMSLLLGKLFASRITRPISRLAGNAVRIAEGERNINLRLRRKDEIGVLSNVLGRMSDDLNERLKAMEIMNRIDKAVLSSISRNDLLDRVIGFVRDYIEKSTVVMAVREEGGSGFEIASSAGNRKAAIMFDKTVIPDSMFSDQASDMLTEAEIYSVDRIFSSDPGKRLNLPGSVRTFFNVPIHLREQYLGSLLIFMSDNRPFTDEQKRTLTKLGDQVGVALQSVKAVEDMNSLQIGSIRALSRSIDAKSRWTAGHSERVAALSEQLGSVLGLEEIELRRLVISALLHDIGKIGISESILDKPAKLTDEEYGIIRQHPEVGYEISKNIPNYEDICDGIRYHHERWNGTGYPSGLRGEEIPLFGRIIAIADVFDALTADRPYREGMSLSQSLEIITKGKNSDFEPEITDIFIDLINSPIKICKTLQAGLNYNYGYQ